MRSPPVSSMQRRNRETFFQALFENAAVGIAVLDADGCFLEVNPRLGQMLGYTVADLLRMSSSRDLTDPDDWRRYQYLVTQVARGRRREFSLERRYRQADGAWLWVKEHVTVLEPGAGPDARLMAVVEDIEARKQSELALRQEERLFRKILEEDLRRHREKLQGLVEERTAEALEANDRVRQAERMTVIGTLSAGLGHDMANLLVPVHIRVEALSRMALSDDAREHLLAIKSSAELLQKLSSGLRLLATDTAKTLRGEQTDLVTWWKETGGILRTVLPGSVALDARLPGNTWVCMSKASLMQAVFNLVQNAGHVLRDRTDGRVLVAAEVDGDHVNIAVTDNGPGMPEEVRTRCIEPFFTTKHRSISTGLGLSIVYGLVKEVGGEVDIHSRLGEGTTFSLQLRRGEAPEARPGTPPRVAVVQIRDARQRAIVSAELRALQYDVSFDTAVEAAPDLVVCDHWPLATAVRARVVLLADGPNAPASAIALGSKPAVQAIRNTLRELAVARP